MKMTIEESILYMELYKRKLFDSVSDLDKDIEAYDIAIDTMCKYQKIEEIVKQYKKFGNIDFSMQIICGVVEDGNDD